MLLVHLNNSIFWKLFDKSSTLNWAAFTYYAPRLAPQSRTAKIEMKIAAALAAWELLELVRPLLL